MLSIKKVWAGLLLGAILLPVFVVAWAADEPKKTLSLTGTYNWSMEKPQKEYELAGTLTPTSDKEWKVEWNFTRDKKPVKWTGTITGDLVNGKCSGTGTDGKGGATFTFEGTATDGAVKFNSAKIMPDKKTQAMGTGAFSVK